MAREDVNYNLQQDLQASGSLGFSKMKINTRALQNVQFGPDIYSPQADSYYNGIGAAAINGMPVSEQLFDFNSPTLSQFSVSGNNGTNFSANFSVGSVQTGRKNFTPKGGWLNAVRIEGTPQTNGKTGVQQTNASGTYSYKIEYNGAGGAPTLVYKDKNGKTIKTADVKDTQLYNAGQKALKDAQEAWKKSHKKS